MVCLYQIDGLFSPNRWSVSGAFSRLFFISTICPAIRRMCAARGYHSRFQYPVVFVRIDQQFGRNTTHYGGIKSSHCLVGKNAVVLFAMNTKDRCIPFVYKLVWRVGECALSHRILFFPVCAAHIPVGKPFFFSFQILHFHVKMPSCAMNALKRLS